MTEQIPRSTCTRCAETERLAACRSVDSWMALADSDKRAWFAQTLIIDSEKAKRISELESALEWHAIDYAPHNQRVLVKSESGEIYAAHWVQHPGTGDEAWCVSEAEDGTQHIIHPVEWRAIAPSDGGRSA